MYYQVRVWWLICFSNQLKCHKWYRLPSAYDVTLSGYAILTVLKLSSYLTVRNAIEFVSRLYIIASGRDIVV